MRRVSFIVEKSTRLFNLHCGHSGEWEAGDSVCQSNLLKPTHSSTFPGDYFMNLLYIGRFILYTSEHWDPASFQEIKISSIKFYDV